MQELNKAQAEVISFTRSKNYEFKKDLGNGACGKAVLLFDPLIKENFACKKYEPLNPSWDFFDRFLNEIKMLYKINHENIIRVFSYHVYPEHKKGYILMEYIEGNNIEDYLESKPEDTNDLFMQTLNAFNCLHSNNILHRDIRPENIMVNDNGVLKIIDFGFAKEIQYDEDIDKSISLNWRYDRPNDFKDHKYDYSTELYFVGKLFEEIIKNNEIHNFKYKPALNKMCNKNSRERFTSFHDILQEINTNKFNEIDFSWDQKTIYQEFADSIMKIVASIDSACQYENDIDKIINNLKKVHKNSMLEYSIQDGTKVVNCLVPGRYKYWPQHKKNIKVDQLKYFIDILINSSLDQKNVIIANLHSRFDGIERYSDNKEIDDDEIPF